MSPSLYYVHQSLRPPQGIPIPRRRKQQEKSDSFVRTVRPSLYPSVALSTPYVQTPQTLSHAYLASPLPIPFMTPATPWMHPTSGPQLPPQTPVWPPIEVVPPIFPYDNEPHPSPEYYEPGTFPAVAWGTPVPVRLNPQLIYNPADPSIPFLEWDISHRPEVAKRHTGRQVIVPPDLLEKATLPPMPNMWIKSDHPVLASWMESWGPIEINTPDCTVRDVLDAIWEYMRKLLTDGDMARVIAAGERENLELSARHRVRVGHELVPVAMNDGFRRVDVLGGHRRFLGLRAVVNLDRTWTIYMGLTSLPVAYS
ncbi:hypothetical protein C0995_000876 [Termitomyces sp. Mi166|nr:hypothetical protein C0995_000876 [Termitomyces sp. Mi166\